MRALLILFAVALVGCKPLPKQDVKAAEGIPGRVYVTQVGGCNYVIWEDVVYKGGAGGITHAGDCPNPIHRNDSLTTPHQ